MIREKVLRQKFVQILTILPFQRECSRKFLSEFYYFPLRIMSRIFRQRLQRKQVEVYFPLLSLIFLKFEIRYLFSQKIPSPNTKFYHLKIIFLNGPFSMFLPPCFAFFNHALLNWAIAVIFFSRF